MVPRLDATGFYFDSLEGYQAKVAKARNAYGQTVEEFEIQFIDGEDIDCDLAKAWGINQANIGGYFEACDNWYDHDKRVFIIAVSEAGYDFDPARVSAGDFDVDGCAAPSIPSIGLWPMLHAELKNVAEVPYVGENPHDEASA